MQQADLLPAPRRASRPWRFLARLAVIVVVVFVLPAGLAAGWWATVDRPSSWREADWSATGMLPPPATVPEAAVYVMAARTGGMKGAFSIHSWIVTKREGDRHYARYDKVGWGMPVRRNAYPADARWYSNLPVIVGGVTGEAAADLVPMVEAAIETYPHRGRSEEDGYRIYPGPNSNSFVAHVLREVPELGLVLPPNAVGRDYLSGDRFVAVADDWLDVNATLYGLVGFAAGARSGIEVHFLGLVAGIDFRRVGIKVPAFGLVSLF